MNSSFLKGEKPGTPRRGSVDRGKRKVSLLSQGFFVGITTFSLVCIFSLALFTYRSIEAFDDIEEDSFTGQLDFEPEQVSKGFVGDPSTKLSVQTAENKIHVFLCSDETDFRPIIVVINSTSVNTRNPDRIVFHLIVPPALQQGLERAVQHLFPSLAVEVDSTSLDMSAISQRVGYFPESKARKELANSFNFASFYFAHTFRSLERAIYLDTDTVVQGDIAALAAVDLLGHPAAAVEDCTQRFGMYFNFRLLDAIREGYNKETCVFNRGIFVLDLAKWREQGVTEDIVGWMTHFNNSHGKLYSYGMSQPPWLLALDRRYKKLGWEWNVRGLGRNVIYDDEKKELAKRGFGASYFREKGLDGYQPFVSPMADDAKVLHFNGKFKPWKQHRHSKKAPSLCGHRLVPCAQLWWNYMSPETDRYIQTLRNSSHHLLLH